MEDPQLILASASPRRRQLLEDAGFKFEIRPAEIDETVRPGEDPEEFVLRMALEKARAVAKVSPGRVVLGADTIVVATLPDGTRKILGKPKSVQDAKDTLRLLSGQRHEVATAVGLAVYADGVYREETFYVTSQVVFRDLTDEETATYVATGEPMDKAGAYAIQGGAAAFVEKYEGSLTNIIGLPMEEVARRLRVCGVDPGGRRDSTGD